MYRAYAITIHSPSPYMRKTSRLRCLTLLAQLSVLLMQGEAPDSGR